MAETAALVRHPFFSFIVPGRIGGKQRAGRQLLPGGLVRSFNPHKTKAKEKEIAQLAALAMRRQGCKQIAGPVHLTITVFQHTPKKWPKKKVAGAAWITGKPDCDNIVKLIADALNEVAWRDDAQIAMLSFARYYDNDIGERVIIHAAALESVTE